VEISLLQRKKVAGLLGLSETDILKDPIAEADTNTSLLKESLKIGKSIELMADGNTDNYSKIVTSIADSLNYGKNIKDISDAVTAISTDLVAANVISKANALSDAIDDMNMTKDNVNEVEKATTVAVGLAKDQNISKIKLDNIVNIIADIKDNIDANETVGVDQLITELNSTIESNASIFSNILNEKDLNTTVSSIKDVVVPQKSEEDISEEIEAQSKATEKLTDRLVLANSQFQYGSDTNVTLKNNTFDLSIDANSSAIQNICFTLEDEIETITETDENGEKYDTNVTSYEMLEDGKSRTMTLGLIVKDKYSSKELRAIVTNITVAKDSLHGYSVTSDASKSKLIATSVNSVGDTSSTSSDGVSIGYNVVTSDNNKVILNVETLLSNLSGTPGLDDVKSQFENDGSYTLSLYVSGVDGMTQFLEVDGDDKPKEMSGVVYGITGNLTVGAGATSSSSSSEASSGSESSSSEGSCKNVNPITGICED
jgi:hypothetical protein